MLRRTLSALNVAGACAGAAAALLGTSCGPAQVIQVTTTTDGDAGSLRAAIDSANRATGEVRIELGSGTYELTRCGADDSNAAGDLDLTTSALVTIRGVTPDVVIRQTCPGERVLESHEYSGELKLSGVTVTGGSFVAANPGDLALGGGVRAAGGVVLERAAIRGNAVTGAQGVGAPAGGTPVPGSDARGGGLFVGRSLSAIDSVIAANTATGGALQAAPTPDGQYASAGTSEGGGAYVTLAAVVAGGTIADNVAQLRGGGVAQGSSSELAVRLSNVSITGNRAIRTDGFGGGTGGGVAASSLIASNVTASNNVAGASGGALQVSGVATLEQVQLVGNSAGAGGGIAAATLNASKVVAHDNEVAGRGGALLITAGGTVRDSNIYDNVAQTGGGMGAGDLTLFDTRVTANRVFGNPTQIPFVTFANVGGGGVYAETLHAERVTVSGNSLHQCTRAPFIGGSGTSQGAGIRGGSVRLVNVTISGNTGPDSCTLFPDLPPEGVGVYAERLHLNHVTLSDNRAGTGIGASATIATAQLTSYRSVAFSTSHVCTDVIRDLRSGEGSGLVVVDSAYNWFTDSDPVPPYANCELAGPGDVQGLVAPILGPLADNGGAVPTRLPGPGSVLLDRIPVEACPQKQDARGVLRPQGSACDVGAVEVESAP